MSKTLETSVADLRITRLPTDNHLRPAGPLQDCVLPENNIESQLVRLWEAVLGKPSIDIEDDFFELGGTSLLAARLFAQIEETFNLSVPLVTLIQAPTIGKLAKVIRTSDWLEAWQSLVPIQSGGVRP